MSHRKKRRCRPKHRHRHRHRRRPKTDGAITYAGYTIPSGSAQLDDVARLRNDDPKAPYLIVARYQGVQEVCRRWPDFAARAGLGGAS